MTSSTEAKSLGVNGVAYPKATPKVWDTVRLIPGPKIQPVTAYKPLIDEEGYEVTDLLRMPPTPHLTIGDRILYNHAARTFGFLSVAYGTENVQAVRAPSGLVLAQHEAHIINEYNQFVMPRDNFVAFLIRETAEAAAAMPTARDIAA